MCSDFCCYAGCKDDGWYNDSHCEIMSFPDAMAILSDSYCHGDIRLTDDLAMNGGMAWYSPVVMNILGFTVVGRLYAMSRTAMQSSL